MSIETEDATPPRPFPADGICDACDAQQPLRYAEKVIQSRGKVTVEDDGTVRIDPFVQSVYDESNDDEWLECPHCLTRFDMPNDYYWA